MEMALQENQITLRGRAEGVPVPSHENHGQQFLRFTLAVERLSGAVDKLNVVVPRGLLWVCPVEQGRHLEVKGEVRSFNNRDGVSGNRLVISVLARSLTAVTEGEDINCLNLVGVVCKPPNYRRTPLGREICDLMLAVSRPYGRSDYLPCIAWGSLARICGRGEVGERIYLSGRLQSRVYQKVEDGVSRDKTAYEVSIMECRR